MKAVLTALPLALWLTVAPALPAGAECGALAGRLPIQPTEEEWRQVMDLEIVHRLIEVADSPIKEGVAIGIVEAGPERVFRVVTDNGNFDEPRGAPGEQPETMPYVKESTVELQPDGGIINYQYLDLPFVTDREYKVRIRNEVRVSDGVTIRESAWTHVKGFGNIDESRGSWRLLECPPGKTLVAYQVFTDPGGWIPTYFKNKATKRSLRALIASVRTRVRDPRYEQTE